MPQLSRVAVVTGGGSGIGLATALMLSSRGYRVFVGDIQFPQQVQNHLTNSGIESIACDVRVVNDLDLLIQHAVGAAGRLDFLVNNAGIGLVSQIDQVSEEDWDRVVDTNLKAAFFGCRAAVRVMKLQSSGGSIVNVASNAGLLPRSHDPVYSISKMALIGLTKSLALCHSVDRIRINAVCPGPVERTRIIEENFDGPNDRDAVTRKMISASPLARAWGRMITPEEVAESICYLCSDAAAMITGTAVAIDGGKSLGVPPQQVDFSESGAAPQQVRTGVVNAGQILSAE